MKRRNFFRLAASALLTAIGIKSALVPIWKVNIGLIEEELKAVLDHLQIGYRDQICGGKFLTMDEFDTRAKI